MALTKTPSNVDLVTTALASATTVVGTAVSIADAYSAQLVVSHATTNTTPHTASTQPSARIEITFDDTANDSWVLFTELAFNTATAATTTLNGATNSGSATVVLTSASNFTRGGIMFFYNGTPANSEWGEIASVSTNTLTMVDALTNTQATATNVYNTGEKRTVQLPFNARRVRVVYFAATGPASCFQTKLLKVTAV